MTQSDLVAFSQNTENIILGAPSVQLDNGRQVIPQHYKTYNHTLASIERLLVDIECEPDVLLFVGRSQGALYLQAGIIGLENYPTVPNERPKIDNQMHNNVSQQDPLSPKLVYGRRWLVSSDTPTSEIIQTAFLAIKKLKEHEIREWFSLYDPASNRTSRPFSTHQDLVLMAANQDLLEPQSFLEDRGQDSDLDNLKDVIARSKLRGRPFKVINVVNTHSGGYLLELELVNFGTSKDSEDASDFGEYQCGVLLDTLHPADCLHRLMDELIAHSDRAVAERFRFRNFARFSRHIDPLAIARISIRTRRNDVSSAPNRFASTFRETNYATDALRVPELGSGELKRKNSDIIRDTSGLIGHMPKGFCEVETNDGVAAIKIRAAR